MGRKPTVNANLPPHMRKRVRSNGRVYYFLDTGEKPRREISLGTDYMAALRKYSELNIDTTQVKNATFDDAARKYMTEVVPKLAKNTQKVHKYDVRHLEKFFVSAPLEQIRPMHIKQFLTRHQDKPTTANRCKRLFSTIWNHARGWGYTDLPNPCEGIEGFALNKRTMYITDDLFNKVYKHASEPLKDAMDLAYLTGQRPADALRMTDYDISAGHLIITQQKTKQPLRIKIVGKLEELIKRIAARKEKSKVATAALLTNTNGKRLTAPVLRNHFEAAREAAIVAIMGEGYKTKKKELTPEAAEIKNFRFYDLRAKAADDVADERGEQAAGDLLGHENVRTTQRHYLRRGKVVEPTK